MKTVIPYFERWIAKLPNIRKLAKAASNDDAQAVLLLWQASACSRARNLMAAAKSVVDDHGGKIPSTMTRFGRFPASANTQQERFSASLSINHFQLSMET